jgi:DNA polymerase-3 subunit alpha
MTITDARENYLSSIDINLNNNMIADDFIEQFSKVLTPYKEGICPVRIFFQREEAQALLELGVQWRVTPADLLLYELRALLGEEQVAMQFK